MARTSGPSRVELEQLFFAQRFPMPLGATASEWTAVRMGLKPMIREAIDARDWEQWKARLVGTGLVARAIPVPDSLESGTGMILAYAGRDRDDIEQAIGIERRQCDGRGETCSELALRHGRLLGYPDCCVRAFADADLRVEEVAIVARAARRTVRFHPLLNNTILSAFHYTSWYPCRYDCERSLSVARTLAVEIERLHPRAQPKLRRLLAMPRLYFDADCQVLFEATRVGATGAHYRRVFTPYAFLRGQRPNPRELEFFIEVVAQLVLGNTLRVGARTIHVERDGRRVADVPGGERAIWMPFAFE